MKGGYLRKNSWGLIQWKPLDFEYEITQVAAQVDKESEGGQTEISTRFTLSTLSVLVNDAIQILAKKHLTIRFGVINIDWTSFTSMNIEDGLRRLLDNRDTRTEVLHRDRILFCLPEKLNSFT